MLRKILFGIPSLPVGNIGVTSFGVIDDVLLHDLILGHSLFG